MKKQQVQIGVAVVMILIGIMARLVDHPWNFVPLTGLALVSAYYLNQRYSWAIFLTVMVLSDLYLGFYDLPVMASVYASYLLVWGLGVYAKKRGELGLLLPITLSSSVIFFLLTNFAVWAFLPYYASGFEGLMQSYAMGLPFFKWTVAGDLFYTTVFVGVIETARLMANTSSQHAQIDHQ